jgi:hypothetical protein
MATRGGPRRRHGAHRRVDRRGAAPARRPPGRAAGRCRRDRGHRHCVRRVADPRAGRRHRHLQERSDPSGAAWRCARGLGLLFSLARWAAVPPSAPSFPAPRRCGADAPIELADTPFFPQEALQCGPAALATVLGAAGVAAHPDALAREVYTPGLGGSLQLELVAAARAARVPALRDRARPGRAGGRAGWRGDRCWCCRTCACGPGRPGITRWSSARIPLRRRCCCAPGTARRLEMPRGVSCAAGIGRTAGAWCCWSPASCRRGPTARGISTRSRGWRRRAATRRPRRLGGGAGVPGRAIRWRCSAGRRRSYLAGDLAGARRLRGAAGRRARACRGAEQPGARAGGARLPGRRQRVPGGCVDLGGPAARSRRPPRHAGGPAAGCGRRHDCAGRIEHAGGRRALRFPRTPARRRTGLRRVVYSGRSGRTGFEPGVTDD